MDDRALGDGDDGVSALRHRTIRFGLVVAALALGWQAFVAVSAPRRVDAALTAQLAGGGYVNVAVTLRPAVIVTVQVGVELVQPVHAANVEPALGVAVSVTTVLWS